MGTIESKIPPKGLLALVNPVMRLLLRSPLHFLVSGFMMLLDFRGRKSGRRFLVTVSYHMVDGVPTAFTGAPWLRNLRGDAPLEIVFRGQRRKARVEIVDDPDRVAAAVHRVLSEIGPSNASKFAFKVTGELPPVAPVREALAGRSMVRVRFE